MFFIIVEQKDNIMIKIGKHELHFCSGRSFLWETILYHSSSKYPVCADTETCEFSNNFNYFSTEWKYFL